ncbi:MAG: hypothetical protein KatS3mg082_1054 [Nitrospiraceae bacterium]|nr:MAG: hypothetical protein KatS3mg082_1054 [Nitrospiraceae bacterium]
MSSVDRGFSILLASAVLCVGIGCKQEGPVEASRRRQGRTRVRAAGHRRLRRQPSLGYVRGVREGLARRPLNPRLGHQPGSGVGDAPSAADPNTSRVLKNYLDTLETQDQNRAHMRSEGPAGCSKRPSSAAAASEEARRTRGTRCALPLQRVSERRASERRENKAGGLFQHPARSWERSGEGYGPKPQIVRANDTAVLTDHHELGRFRFIAESAASRHGPEFLFAQNRPGDPLSGKPRRELREGKDKKRARGAKGEGDMRYRK